MAIKSCCGYCNVLGVLFQDGFFISTQEFNNVQRNSINNSPNTARQYFSVWSVTELNLTSHQRWTDYPSTAATGNARNVSPPVHCRIRNIVVLLPASPFKQQPTCSHCCVAFADRPSVCVVASLRLSRNNNSIGDSLCRASWIFLRASGVEIVKKESLLIISGFKL
jgi:hypothetical protein